MRKQSIFRLTWVLLIAALVFAGASCSSDSGGGGSESVDTDVVVVGGGLAGLSAAISAVENGAGKVTLIEKTGAVGGSSGRSGGGITGPNSSVQQRYGIADSISAWKELWEERQAKSVDSEQYTGYPKWDKVNWLVNQGAAIIDWMVSLGVKYDRPGNYGFDTVNRIHFVRKVDAAENTSGSGGDLIEYLRRAAVDKGIEILLDHKAIGLVKSGDKITGVEIDVSGGRKTIRAKAVVLAAGGFSNSKELLERFIPETRGMEIGSMAPDSCTGDGILMAEAAGAALYENPWVIGFNTSPFPGAPSQLGLFSAGTPTLLYVDPSGKRVMNESQHYAIVTGYAIRAGGVLYAIFDSDDYHNPAQTGTTAASRIEAAIAADTTIVGKHVFKSTTSVADLGSQIFHASVQSDFTTQISDYNGFVAAPTSPGDTEFGKDAAYLVNSIDTGPFYAVKVRPHIMGTFGGVKTIVETGEVLDTTNRVIPGLYAAGENANRVFFNQVYMSGGALLVASSTGKAAGAAAARYSK